MFTFFVLAGLLLLGLFFLFDYIRHDRNQKRLTVSKRQRRLINAGWLDHRVCLKHPGHDLRKCVSCDGTGDGNLYADLMGDGEIPSLRFKVCTHCAGHGERWVDPDNVSDLT